MWFSSSYSNDAGGECVQGAWTEAGAVARDSKDLDGPVMVEDGRTWRLRGGSGAAASSRPRRALPDRPVLAVPIVGMRRRRSRPQPLAGQNRGHGRP
ncbi:DUF397 domain-containing protein [Streptomyces sp. NPDC059766]|uniref:DUF397 domain-containing protein n=1 Tax=Streptomyces sp. NPDC059766 TaxID=3346940 RepID=UPI0036621E45